MIRVLVVLVPLVPAVAAVLFAGLGWGSRSRWLGPLSTLAVTAGGIAIGARVLAHGPVGLASNLLRVDALSAFMIIVVGLVGLIATYYGAFAVSAEVESGATSARRARLYGVLVEMFLAAMLVAVVANNLGVLWVAVEATTIATALLVGHRNTRKSVEASWKYVVVGSVGVALAFLGTVLVYFASRHVGTGRGDLNWSSLVATAPRLDPPVMRLAIGLLVLGFGTKMGLAPMHTWLPDAHSQAPAPVSALMSGVLLSVAFYALLRYKVIADAALGVGYMRWLLVVASVLSLLVAASLLIAQRDYKRMLAYSSIEHMGLVGLAGAIGTPLAIAAALLHVLGHGLVKAVAFCTSGEIVVAEGTSEIRGVRALLVRRPAIGALFTLSLLGLLGLPPLALFASEIGVVRAGVTAGLGWIVGLALLLMFVAFAAIANHGHAMLLGDAGEPEISVLGDAAVRVSSGYAEVDVASAARRGSRLVPLWAGLLIAVGLGMTVWPIESLLLAAAAVVAR